MRLVFTVRRERWPFGVYANRPALHSGSGFHVPRMAFAVPAWPTRGMLLTTSFRLRRTRRGQDTFASLIREGYTRHTCLFARL